LAKLEPGSALGMNISQRIWGQAVTRPHKIQLDQLGLKKKIKKSQQQASNKLDSSSGI
jgi:hypothetical protein